MKRRGFMAALSALFGGAASARAAAPAATKIERTPFAIHMSAEGPITALAEVAEIRTSMSGTIEKIQVSVPDGETVEIDIKRNRGESLGGTFVVAGPKTHQLSPAVHLEAGDLLTLDINRCTGDGDGPITVRLCGQHDGQEAVRIESDQK